MNPSRLFIVRPVATVLTMIAILLAGALAYRHLPVSALPQVDYPTIQVLTFYPGAGPDVMTSSITAPLERQFGQMPGLNQMTSSSSGGSSIITLQFSLDIDLDIAEQEVQAAMNSAATFLPRDLPAPPVYNKVNPADAPILTLALTSATLPLSQVRDFAETRFAQKISQLSGVGLVSISGGQRPAVRIQANPRALAAYGLTMEDLRLVVAAANVNQAKGGFDGPRRASIINATDQLFASKDYRALIVTYRNGAPVRLSEVADVIDDVENTKQAAWMNETPAVIVHIQRQPGTNVIEVVDRVKELLPQLQGTLPSSMQVSVLTDRTTSIRATVRDVQFELGLAVALVILVIFLFLRTLPATVIPAVAVPLSLIGTFGVMYLMGFSLNNLTLMALTISTGFVVDDAIVMIENIARYIERGASPFQAALKGSKQIAFTILSLTVSLIAVLIPLLFMGDVVGRLFREFAVTLSITILISAVVSLTLTPMMCARLLRERREEQPGPLSRASQRMLDRIIAGYGRSLQWVLQRQQATLVVTAATLVVTVALFVLIPKGFFPLQDTGVILGITEGPQTVSFGTMAERQQALARVILEEPAVESLTSFIGVDGTNTTLNSGRIYINLKPLGERLGAAEALDVNAAQELAWEAEAWRMRLRLLAQRRLERRRITLRKPLDNEPPPVEAQAENANAPAGEKVGIFWTGVVRKYRVSARPTARPSSPRARALISIAAFFLCWELLSLASPYLGIPPFAVPSLLRIGQSFSKITAIDILVTLARVIAALVVSFVLGVLLGPAGHFLGRLFSLATKRSPRGNRILIGMPLAYLALAVLVAWQPAVMGNGKLLTQGSFDLQLSNASLLLLILLKPIATTLTMGAGARGGRITPGVYDLTSAQRVGAATGWPGARAVAVDVAENPNGGVTLNWAGTIPGGNVDRWTATLTETPTVRVAYTCGRIGEVDADFAAAATTLQLRMPDGADGHLVLDFQRRG